MILRLLVALGVGALVGLERELVGKEAGIRTSMMVAAGASIFAMIALMLPYILTSDPSEIQRIISGNGGVLGIMANVVVGIGFLGAGIIIKTENSEHVHGLTTAAVIWATAGLGILVGLGMIRFAAVAACIFFIVLFIFRKLSLYQRFALPENQNPSQK